MKAIAHFATPLAKRSKAALVALFLVAVYSANARASECFDDQQLQQLQTPGNPVRGTLIYVWSPRMVYSVSNMSLASRAAAAAGLDFVVVHDMRVPRQEMLQHHPLGARSPRWLNSSDEPRSEPEPERDLATPPFVSLLDSSRPLCAPKLIQSEALRHFPTAFVVSAGGIHPHPIVGAMPWQAWVSSLDQRLSQQLNPRLSPRLERP